MGRCARAWARSMLVTDTTAASHGFGLGRRRWTPQLQIPTLAASRRGHRGSHPGCTICWSGARLPQRQPSAHQFWSWGACAAALCNARQPCSHAGRLPDRGHLLLHPRLLYLAQSPEGPAAHARAATLLIWVFVPARARAFRSPSHFFCLARESLPRGASLRILCWAAAHLALLYTMHVCSVSMVRVGTAKEGRLTFPHSPASVTFGYGVLTLMRPGAGASHVSGAQLCCAGFCWGLLGQTAPPCFSHSSFMYCLAQCRGGPWAAALFSASHVFQPAPLQKVLACHLHAVYVPSSATHSRTEFVAVCTSTPEQGSGCLSHHALLHAWAHVVCIQGHQAGKPGASAPTTRGRVIKMVC